MGTTKQEKLSYYFSFTTAAVTFGTLIITPFSSIELLFFLYTEEKDVRMNKDVF